MFGIILSALNAVLGSFIRSIVVKFGMFFALYFVVSAFAEVLITLLPDNMNLNSLLNTLPEGVWYFINLLNFSSGISLVLSAFATRFIIRRIPVIG